jgi:hypothetical protein
MMNPTEDQRATIEEHAEYLLRSEQEMDKKDQAHIKWFKAIVQYEKCISVLNYDNFTNLSYERRKQEYESSHASNQDSTKEMTREEVDFHANKGKEIMEK